MALTGLDIYKLLPKTNCKDCGFATCLAFAMALAQKKVCLDKCPHVTAQAKSALESASQPPIKLVTIGTGENKLEIGNETVMFRHEQKFYHPAGIGILVEDTLNDSEADNKISKINGLSFERVGQIISVNLICLKNRSGDKNKFIKLVKRVVSASSLNIALHAQNLDTLAEALNISKGRRPLVICDNIANIDGFVKLVKENNVPLAVTCADLEEAAALTARIKQGGVEEIVINPKGERCAQNIQDFTFIRRSALKKNFRPLGYPLMAITFATEPHAELAEAITYVAKYAGLVIVKNTDKEVILPILVARQDIYSDPQKPVQVEPKIYEIGKVDKSSPILITTNFS
jgi:acetyl-CoA decarbonylase/synthase complex subunit gamma